MARPLQFVPDSSVVDGLKGFPEAITAVFPQAQIQTCIVHLIRNSLDFVSWKDRKTVAAELKTIYRAATETKATLALEAFADGAWGLKYPPIASIWQRHWQEIIPFFAYPLEVRKIIYTTNAIESLHMQVRKVIKNRGHFPHDQAAIKLIYLALRNITKDWKIPPSYMAICKNSICHFIWRSFYSLIIEAVKFNPDFGHTKFLTGS